MLYSQPLRTAKKSQLHSAEYMKMLAALGTWEFLGAMVFRCDIWWLVKMELPCLLLNSNSYATFHILEYFVRTSHFKGISFSHFSFTGLVHKGEFLTSISLPPAMLCFCNSPWGQYLFQCWCTLVKLSSKLMSFNFQLKVFLWRYTVTFVWTDK